MTQEKRRRIISGISLFVFLLLLLLLSWIFNGRIASIVKNPEEFRLKMAEKGGWGALIFLLLITLQVVFAIVPGQPFAFAGGYCFGPFWGVLLTFLGTMLGSFCAFLLARHLGLRAVTAFYSEKKLQKLAFLKETRNLHLITFLLFLIPGLPKDMLSYCMGLTPIASISFLLISGLGRLPALCLTVLSGTALQTKSQVLVIVILSVFLLLSAIGFFFYHTIRAKRKQQRKNANG